LPVLVDDLHVVIFFIMSGEICCKVLCYLVIKGELFIITYNSLKHKQKIVISGSYRVNNNRELEQFVTTSGISSYTV